MDDFAFVVLSIGQRPLAICERPLCQDKLWTVINVGVKEFMETTRVKTLIIGAGFGGLCMGVKLKEAGEDDFLIIEAADALGGTWRDNTYPGAECDIPSALYSFSFAQNPTWDFKWAKQPQILTYQNKVADDYGLRAHMRFNRAVVSCVYDEIAKRWRVTTREGHIYDCEFLITAVGQLHHPNTPKIKGAETFSGDSFHSAKWNHDIDLRGKRVGVIGNAASAVQFIPEIAEVAGELTVYQRSANWVVDKGDRPYTRLEKWLAKRAPVLANIYRFGLWSLGEYIIWPVIKGAKLRAAALRWKNRFDMRAHIKDKELQQALTPTYPVGAKRILFSDKYYAALARENVELVLGAPAEITPNGILDVHGTERAHDVIIYGTGFHTNPFLKSIDVRGQGGAKLSDKWSDGAYAYLGVSNAGYPNMFMLYGPNTNTGHTSIIFKLECQVGYVTQLMQAAETKGPLSVKTDVEAAFNDEMQTRLSKLVWNQVENSWYKDGTRLTNNWPGSSREYKRRLKRPDMSHFEVA
jgi:cation diffusion facilitator CzcD-associated flavoprotein CzcO